MQEQEDHTFIELNIYLLRLMYTSGARDKMTRWDFIGSCAVSRLVVGDKKALVFKAAL